MKRLLAGGAALAFAAAGAVALASPLSAQEGADVPELSASLAPDPAEPGATVTVSSVDPCPAATGDHERALAYYLQDEAGNTLDTNEVIITEDGEELIDWDALVQLDEAGGWEFTVQAPEAPGIYGVGAVCYEDSEEAVDPMVPVPVNPCTDLEGFAAENPDLCFPEVPCEDELAEDACYDTDAEPLNPCTELEGFADENPDLCSVNLCETEEGAADERCQVIIGVAPTAYYLNVFEVASPAAAPATPVTSDPGFTG